MSEPSLSEFLLARIAEDEEDARHAQQGSWKLWGFDVYADVVGDSNLDTAIPVADVRGIRVERPDGSWSLRAWSALHIARHYPARVLADCAAKRAIMEMSSPDLLGILQALASPYADHEDFRAEWK